jgi:hypothetical protein
MNEHLEKIQHDAGFLRGDLHTAYVAACYKEPLLAIMLGDMMADAMKMDDKITQIVNALKAEGVEK